MSRFVHLLNTSHTRVCVDIDKVLYAAQYEGYLRLTFGNDTAVNVGISIDEFYDLATGKSK